MSNPLRKGLRLLAELKRRRLPLALVLRIGLARFRSYGLSGLLQRLEYWAHQLRIDDSPDKYPERIHRLATLDPRQLRAMRKLARRAHGPRITVLILARGGCGRLQAAVDSMLRQLYDDWELYVIADASGFAAAKAVVARCGRDLDRIHLAEAQAGLGAAADRALGEAAGKLLAVLRSDGALREDALLIAAAQLGVALAPGLVYGDECEVDAQDRIVRAHFKPAWNPELLLGQNYIGCFFVAHTELLRKAGGFRSNYEGALEHDVILRLAGVCPSDRIHHVPYLIYRRTIASEAGGALVNGRPEEAKQAGRRAVQQYLLATGRPAEVQPGPLAQTYRVRLPLPVPRPLVSIIIPTRNASALLRRCVETIFEKTAYEELELLIVDNRTEEPVARQYLSECAARPKVRVLSYDYPFNYSAINNLGASQAVGAYLCLLNNDTEVITPEWLGELVMWASQPGIGAVGAKLLYPDNSIQHAGITLGIMGLAGHAYRGATAADVPLLAVAHEVGAVTGACLMVSRAHFDAAGGLDEEHLAVSYNDVDLCLRLRAMGLRNIWTPHATLYHHESRSRGRDDSPAKRERFEEEADYMLAKWKPELSKDPTYNPNLSPNREDYALGWPPRVPPAARYLEALLKPTGQR